MSELATALDANPARLDEHERGFVAKVREHGWAFTSVAQDHEWPGFGYTTGLWLNCNFPELITFSLKADIVHATCLYMFRELKAGRTVCDAAGP